MVLFVHVLLMNLMTDSSHVSSDEEHRKTVNMINNLPVYFEYWYYGLKFFLSGKETEMLLFRKRDIIIKMLLRYNSCVFVCVCVCVCVYRESLGQENMESEWDQNRETVKKQNISNFKCNVIWLKSSYNRQHYWLIFSFL
jgi:hypothetical protein